MWPESIVVEVHELLDGFVAERTFPPAAVTTQKAPCGQEIVAGPAVGSAGSVAGLCHAGAADAGAALVITWPLTAAMPTHSDSEGQMTDVTLTDASALTGDVHAGGGAAIAGAAKTATAAHSATIPHAAPLALRTRRRRPNLIVAIVTASLLSDTALAPPLEHDAGAIGAASAQPPPHRG
jgi:hypothetical protein